MASDPRGKPLSIQLSWPVAVLVYRNGLKNPGSPYLAFDEGGRWPNEATNIYLHRDAARAWAGLAMWCMCDPEFGPVAYEWGQSYGTNRENARYRAWQALRDWLDGDAALTLTAWARFTFPHERAPRIHLCDSDAPGAFPLYRRLETKQ